MNFLQIGATLEAELISFWAARTPIFFANSTISTAEDYYIKVNIVPADSVQIEISRCSTIDVVGTFVISVVGPPKVGEGQIITYADLLNNHFSLRTYSTVSLGAGRILTIGEVENKYIVNVELPYSVYQTRS